jgi:hypothetical protein
MPYNEKYPAGTDIRIVGPEQLEAFRREWKYHHPLSDQQLLAAGSLDRVKAVGFYHGGDVLYELERLPGTWHEICLEAVRST